MIDSPACLLRIREYRCSIDRDHLCCDVPALIARVFVKDRSDLEAESF